MLRKALLVAVLLLCVGAVSLVAYGYYFVTSEPVHVDMQYAVALEIVSVVDSNITLRAIVTNNGLPVRPGLVVDFYYAVDGSDWIYFATGLTDEGYVAQAICTATHNGGYDFKAIVTIP